MVMQHHVITFIGDKEVRVRSSETPFSTVIDGASREVHAEADLGVWSTQDLVRLYNHLTPGKHVKGFHDKAKATAAVWALLTTCKPAEAPEGATALSTGTVTAENQPAAAQNQDTTSAEGSNVAGEQSSAGAEGTTQAGTAEGGAAAETEEEMAKRKAAAKSGKAKTPKAPKEPKGPGVIGTIIDILTNGGGTVDQIVAKLAKKFPDRDADGMKSTVKIQVGGRLVKDKKLAKINKEESDKGLIYSAPKSAVL